MKRRMRKGMLMFALAGIFTVGTISTACAKFWGWQTTSTTDWADGICAYRETCQIHYVFWIAGEETCTTTTIACVN
jgi:hypothetical protein